MGSEEQREEEAGADSYPSRHTRDFGYAGDGDGQGEEAGREYSGDGGIHPATRRMDTEWSPLATSLLKDKLLTAVRVLWASA